MTTKFVKDPDEVLDYLVDWAAWLPDGDTIATATFVTDADEDSGFVIQDGKTSHTTTSATVWVAGGTIGSTFTVVHHVTTAGGREGERNLAFQIKTL